MKNKDPPQGPDSVLAVAVLLSLVSPMTIKRFLKTTNSVLGELEKIAIKAFLLAILIHELYKIVAHH